MTNTIKMELEDSEDHLSLPCVNSSLCYEAGIGRTSRLDGAVLTYVSCLEESQGE